MAGQIIISNIKTDSDNAFSILANTGAVLFSANLASGITTNIANTRITGTITAGQLATSLNLATNNVQVSSIQSATGTPALTIAANGQLSSVNTAVANVTTLNATSGVLATQNGMTGIAKAWVNYNGATQTINSSFNVSSVTRNSTGYYTVNFTTAMPNANYAQSLAQSPSYGAAFPTPAINSNSSTLGEVAPTTTACSFICAYSLATYFDAKYINFIAFAS